MILEVENIKCGGCANGINQKLSQIDGINDVQVDVENGMVTVNSSQQEDTLKPVILAKLESMGYPEKGSTEGLSSIKAKATSYVSCAIGKMSD